MFLLFCSYYFYVILFLCFFVSMSPVWHKAPRGFHWGLSKYRHWLLEPHFKLADTQLYVVALFLGLEQIERSTARDEEQGERRSIVANVTQQGLGK